MRDLPLPPESVGAAYSYLTRIVRDLNLALAETAQAVPVKQSGSAKLTEPEAKRLGAVKSMIVKTADTVRREMDALETRLHGEYTAQSVFGTFEESVDARLRAEAGILEQQVDYSAALTERMQSVDASLSALGEALPQVRQTAESAGSQSAAVGEALRRYTAETSGFIRQGMIGYREDGVTPQIGVAIGQELRVTGETVTGADGREYEVLDRRCNMSVWTPERLSFYIDGTEAAYFSNSTLYVTDIRVGGTLTLGSWQITTAPGLTVRWA